MKNKLKTLFFRGNVLTIFLLMPLTGCDKKPTHAPESTSTIGPTTASTAPGTAQIQSKHIDSFDQRLSDSEPRFSFWSLDGQSGFVFVDIDKTATQSHPGIVIVRKGKYEVVELNDGRFNNHGWVRGYISHDGKSLWAVTDGVIESPDWDIHVIHSTDEGSTWTVASIHKPYYQAGLDSIRIRSDGSGELSLLYDNREGAPTNVSSGYYIYTTHDWGSSWSVSVHVSDILTGPNSIPPERCSPQQNLSTYLKDSLKPASGNH